ncbi:MAG: dockerin type I repeat-containing protein, partial [Ruminococcus sp.]|nr:dockerin type I repeat-containing protein [Ruminococcus sp.]
AIIYGKSAGTTEYTIEIDGQEIHSGKIEISEPAVQDFPAAGQEEYHSETTYSSFYGDENVVLTDGKLYGIVNGKLYLYEQNVEKFRHVYYNGDTSDFRSSDGIILSDGTFKIDGQTIENPDGAKFIDAMNYYLLDENGRIYAIEKNSGEFSAVPIGENCREFIENSLFYAVSNEGEILYLKNNRTDDGMKYIVFNTGIMNCISMKNDYFVDENNILWEVIRYGNEPSVKKKAQDVVFVGYRWYSDGMVNGCVHIKSDGTAYSAGSDRMVELFDKNDDEMCCKEFGYFTIEGMTGAGGMSDYSDSANYIITYNNELTLSFNGTKTVIPDAAHCIRGVMNDEKAEVLFIRTDNTIWKYNLPDCTYTQLIAEEPQKTTEFDVNGDGFFTIADGIALESYLLKDVKPANLNAADINKDNRIDIFDFVLMRKKLIEKNAL